MTHVPKAHPAPVKKPTQNQTATKYNVTVTGITCSFPSRPPHLPYTLP